MKFNKKETKESYIFPVTGKYYRYLAEREVISKEYKEALEGEQVGILMENVVIIQKKPFCVNCILGESNESIFDIIGNNEIYKLSKETGTVFAVLYGDDYLFFKPQDPHVYYKSISTDEEVLVANTYKDFIELIWFEEGC